MREVEVSWESFLDDMSAIFGRSGARGEIAEGRKIKVMNEEVCVHECMSVCVCLCVIMKQLN